MRDFLSTVCSQAGMYWAIDKHDGSWARRCTLVLRFGAIEQPIPLACTCSYVVLWISLLCSFVESALLESCSMISAKGV